LTSNHDQFTELVAVMAHLRGADGCPWDREQNHETLKPFLLEEAYEVLEAIDDGDDGELCGELGDVLLQVVFHSQVAAEVGRFNIDDVPGDRGETGSSSPPCIRRDQRPRQQRRSAQLGADKARRT